ncbi:MAG: NYN domain-containing protein, partial [Trebonia sp.]
MDRCALFVDAGYVLTDGAMAVHGTRRRESVTWDYAGLLQLLGNLATERARLPLLRCYWYEATVEGRRSAEHDALADLPGVKLRLAKMRPGHKEGVEGEIHRDLATLARNKAVSDVMVVSAEEDLAQVIADVQDTGMRVTLLHIADDGSRTISRALRQECDDILQVSAAQLRPYVELISGAEPPRPEETDAGQVAPRFAMNGNGVIGNVHAPAAGRPAAYAQPHGRPGEGPQPAVPPAA